MYVYLYDRRTLISSGSKVPGLLSNAKGMWPISLHFLNEGVRPPLPPPPVHAL